MTPARMAQLHRAAFLRERPWSDKEFSDLTQSRFVRCFDHAFGFALTRTLAGESELLTLAVDPDHQGKGIGQELLQNWLDSLPEGTETAFLEVASDNQPAINLYQKFKFIEAGRRAAYYSRSNGTKADAIVMRRAVTFGHGHVSHRKMPESG
ncbi:GNAT family N-acetyltransferase [Sulfitobacter mediterraneus]|uniref:GNAT family N-acetyltransferase n=2 Tax=Roseobacteraceae TaxID=2854170 RepID=UPI0019325FC1|nr:GNAT family N-acetyltransferase [Sulfitobacter mediterraneus]UWR14503.1 GNAT family N-acetyltransferase [Sulfitobacter sp. M368]MBM1642456.1 GNAT family N-acetyltransferase [Sulfitobacter mediterraneus]MBM1646504.1 GNAT family N-acetyltransferase [Sulfitobacter mediterraneus]MBM1650550.1 GNAT family N-acetyltransferase [Sulfitobacter mediterraneus]